MLLRTRIRRLVSILLAMALMMPALSVVAEAAVGVWLSPKPGEQITSRNVEVAVGYNTQSELRVTRLELWIDGSFNAKKVLVRPDSRGVCSFWWDAGHASSSQHSLVVKIFSGADLISTIKSSATVGRSGYDFRAPTVRFVNIKSGDILKGNMSITIDANDDSGEPPIVSFMVDNMLKLLTNNRPYSYTLETAKYSDGGHELQSYAYDNAGNKSDPAVVKVQFMNGMKRPVVASLSVTPSTDASALREDYVPEFSRPVPQAPSLSKLNSNAARSPEPAKEMSKPVVATPIAQPAKLPSAHVARTVSKPTPVVQPLKHIASAAAKPAAHLVIKPAVAAQSARVAMNNAVPQLRKQSRAVAVASANVPSRPIIMEAARAASVLSGVVDVKPQMRTASVKSEPMSNAIAEPKVTEPPKAAEPAQMTIASAPSLRDNDTAELTTSGSIAAEFPSGEPTLALQDKMVVSHSQAVLKKYEVARVIDGSIAKPELPTSMDASTVEPKPVRVALVPTVRSENTQRSVEPTIVAPQAPKVSLNARLKEKATVHSSGKVKLRDLFNKLGGVLFWDPFTHTVTGFVGNMKLEINIGSKTVSVNGNKMRVASAPVIVGGRTVVDVGLYRQACAMLASGNVSASAE